MAANMRPLTLGEILDHTVQLYRRNFLLFSGIAFLPSAFYVLISGSAGIFFTSRMPAMPQGGQPNLQAMLAIAAFGIVFLVIGLPLLLSAAALAFSALTHAAFQRNREEPASIASAFAYGYRHFWRNLGIFFLQILFAAVIPIAVFSVVVFGAAMITALLAGSAVKSLALVTGFLTILMMLAVLFVCVWIWLRYCLAFPAAIVEDKRAWPSLQRSVQLSKGTRGRIFVMYLMVTILTLVTYYALTLPIDIALKLTLYKSMAGLALFTRPPVILQVINLFISCLERTFVLPIYAIALLLFYNDQRTRNEGYDIEQLMVQAGWPQQPAWSQQPPAPFAPAAPYSVPVPVQPPPEKLAPEPAFLLEPESGILPSGPVQSSPAQSSPVQSGPAQSSFRHSDPNDPSPEETGS